MSASGEFVRYLENDEVFLANYGDVLTDAPLNDQIEDFLDTDAVAQFLAVPPQDSFHVIKIGAAGLVDCIQPVAEMDMRINGGYFVLRQGIFDYLEQGDDLVMDGCVRAANAGRLRAAEYDGFWAPMDTLKERTTLEKLHQAGLSPWALWRDGPPADYRVAPVVDQVIPPRHRPDDRRGYFRTLPASWP